MSLDFKYERDDSGRPRDTICSLYRLDNPSDKIGVLIGIGVASCNPKDQLRKATGRKIALGRALRDRGYQEIDKSMRAAIWNAYLEHIELR